MAYDAYVIDAVRTPVGRLGGALATVRPDDLAAGTLRALIGRSPWLDPAIIDEVYLGAANQAGEDNRNVARMSVLLAGLPTSIPGATMNRLCGSGLEAIIGASRALTVGDADIAVAGGVESMSRAPWISISRDEQDEFALGSHQRAHEAWESHAFDAEMTPVDGSHLARDESIRPDTTLERLAKLAPVFRTAGTVTAGNASPMNDGAAMLLLMSRDGVARTGASPIARIVAVATSGVEPHRYGIGPVAAARTALHRAGLTWGDVASVELNEAFAAQSIACLRSWPDLDPAKVNSLGGAIAIGHPLGASGARIMTTLVHHLRRTGGRYGVAAMCIGVGQGIAVVIENVVDNVAKKG